MIRDALLVAAKDLRLERRSRIGMAQVLPFAVLVLLLFAFALDPDRGVLTKATPGLFWVTVLFSSVLTLQRSFGVEAEDGILEALRLSGMAPASIFFGKVAALVVQLLALEVVLAFGVAVFYDTEIVGLPLLVVIAVVTTIGIAASGSIYGALSARLRSRDTLLPLLLLPLLAPVLISASRGFEVALEREAVSGWPWAALLALFALLYLVLGSLLFRPLLEDS
ncbi:MAG TPA: heme exporter protein CcmB [Microthrixaceae bacterium]|nr:heme exporter protein CcmB [Microthrixaceae bacterium]